MADHRLRVLRWKITVEALSREATSDTHQTKGTIRDQTTYEYYGSATRSATGRKLDRSVPYSYRIP
eukprot:scaffold602748_cov18-Prasinocladus_malaysianus.AAC.1